MAVTGVIRVLTLIGKIARFRLYGRRRTQTSVVTIHRRRKGVIHVRACDGTGRLRDVDGTASRTRMSNANKLDFIRSPPRGGANRFRPPGELTNVHLALWSVLGEGKYTSVADDPIGRRDWLHDSDDICVQREVKAARSYRLVPVTF